MRNNSESENAWINAFAFDFDTLINSSQNILVNNINFKTGYYFKEHPQTSDFVSKVLSDQATILFDKLLCIQDEISQEFSFDKRPVPSNIQAEFSSVLTFINTTFIKNDRFNWDTPNGFFYTHRFTKAFVSEVQSVWANNLKGLLESLKVNSLNEMKKLNMEVVSGQTPKNESGHIENQPEFPEYVLMLVLSSDNKNIVTIKKDRGPAHLINKITFPGGHIEDCDRTMTFDQVPFLAASRELKEETNLDISYDKWKSIDVQWGQNYCLHVLAAQYEGDIYSAKTMESEVVSILDVSNSLREFDQEILNPEKKYTEDFGIFLRRSLEAFQPYRRPSM